MIRYLMQLGLLLAWGLWLGGMVLLLVAVTVLFRTLDRPVAGEGATAIFLAFERYQWFLAAAALICAAGLRWRSAGRGPTILLILLALAAAAALLSGLWISPTIAHMRELGQTEAARFARLHGLSSMIYLIQLGALAIAAPLVRRAMGN